MFLLLVEWYNRPMSKSQKVSPVYYLIILFIPLIQGTPTWHVGSGCQQASLKD